MAGDSRDFTTRDGVRLSYIEAGAGPPLVPGWSQTAAQFRHQIDLDITDATVVAHSSHVPPSTVEWQARTIPGAELETFEAADGGAHFMFMENPGTFNERLVRFIG